MDLGTRIKQALAYLGGQAQAFPQAASDPNKETFNPFVSAVKSFAQNPVQDLSKQIQSIGPAMSSPIQMAVNQAYNGVIGNNFGDQTGNFHSILTDKAYSGLAQKNKSAELANPASNNSFKIITAPNGKTYWDPNQPDPELLPQNQDPLAGYRSDTRVNPPKEIKNLIGSVAGNYGIPAPLIAAVIMNESGFNPKAKNTNANGSTDRGWGQINSSAFPQVSDQQAEDPNFAIDFVGKKLAEYRDAFGGDLSKAVMAYNRGANNPSLSGNKPDSFAQQYLDRVAANLTPDMIKKLGLKVK